jgi:4-hydroxy-tetrahydrodipicolinate synthase
MDATAPHDRIYIAAVNPLDFDGNVDEAQLRSLLRYFLAELPANPDLGLIINPEAGEIFYLSTEEQERILSIALDEVAGAVPIFAGVLANSTADTVAAARRIAASGVEGLFIMPPIGAMDITIAWNPDRYPEVWGDMIGAIVDAVPDRPLICHPVAAPTAGYGAGLPYGATMRLLTEYPQIVGWKMTYNYEGFRKLTRGIRSLDHHVGILAATGVNFHENLATGI